ncbi:MAG: alpha/beta hydrolase [Faecalicatena sp.]|uniref:alpha/beta hydrolase n=1 Tax=Faecalicatena sp. TaxID=2005360 RepID=UPI00258DB6A9|nr:alpha/beta hydrolase [Faecalicatena sp.]MCI6466148.1 alpha/beta hydrolase [Faecalicatena sp.]MDY5619313.1 alpha/beta hydrolase [Lachnospiraceae bacterium]
MNQMWKRILLAAGVLGALDCLLVGAFFNMAAGRNCIFFRKKKEKKSKNKRRRTRSNQAPQEKSGHELWEEQVKEERTKGVEWMQRMPYENVQIRSEEGLLLAGSYLEAEDARRIVVLFHGWRGSWQHDFGACLRWLYEEGTSLLIVEQRSQGQSEGKYMGFGILERRDCHAWLKWLAKRNGSGLPVYLYGVSMGAATVLMAASDKLPGDVKGVIADCGFTSPYEMVYRFGHSKFKLNEHPIMDQLNWVFRKKAGYDLKEYSALEAMEHCLVPVLFIHGKADTFVPYEMSVQNYEACTAKKKLLLVEGAEHCMSYLKGKEQYQQAVREFFREAGA